MRRALTDGDQLIECDGCYHIELLDNVKREWVSVRSFLRTGPWGGAVLSEGEGDDEMQVTVDACSMACYRKAMARVADMLATSLRARP